MRIQEFFCKKEKKDYFLIYKICITHLKSLENFQQTKILYHNYHSMKDKTKFIINEISRLRDAIGRLHSFASFANRKRFYTEDSKMTEEMETYLIDMIEDDWDCDLYINQFYIEIFLRKTINSSDSENTYNIIVERMYDIKYKLLKVENIDSKFLITFNGIPQQIGNPKDYREPIYKYQGIGDSVVEKVRVKIDFILI